MTDASATPVAPRLLLFSSSRVPGDERYLTWAADLVRDFFGREVRTLAFVPFAGVTISFDEYTARTRDAFGEIGYEVRSVHEAGDPRAVVREADAVLVGGGNTFQLLARVYATGLRDVIRERVAAGMPYMGWSAGSNLACPTIRTTNDMPVVQPPAFDALGFVPFQVNPHYTDYHPPGHRGETRADRLAEFVALNPGVPVVGLREGSILRREGDQLQLLGAPPDAALFGLRDRTTIAPGDDLGFLLRR